MFIFSLVTIFFCAQAHADARWHGNVAGMTRDEVLRGSPDGLLSQAADLAAGGIGEEKVRIGVDKSMLANLDGEAAAVAA